MIPYREGISLKKCRVTAILHEIGIDIKFPKSGSLRDGKMIAEVEERNPSYLAKCNQLLDMIN